MHMRPEETSTVFLARIRRDALICHQDEVMIATDRTADRLDKASHNCTAPAIPTHFPQGALHPPGVHTCVAAYFRPISSSFFPACLVACFFFFFFSFLLVFCSDLPLTTLRYVLVPGPGPTQRR